MNTKKLIKQNNSMVHNLKIGRKYKLTLSSFSKEIGCFTYDVDAIYAGDDHTDDKGYMMAIFQLLNKRQGSVNGFRYETLKSINPTEI